MFGATWGPQLGVDFGWGLGPVLSQTALWTPLRAFIPQPCAERLPNTEISTPLKRNGRFALIRRPPASHQNIPNEAPLSHFSRFEPHSTFTRFSEARVPTPTAHQTIKPPRSVTIFVSTRKLRCFRTPAEHAHQHHECQPQPRITTSRPHGVPRPSFRLVNHCVSEHPLPQHLSTSTSPQSPVHETRSTKPVPRHLATNTF